MQTINIIIKTPGNVTVTVRTLFNENTIITFKKNAN